MTREDGGSGPPNFWLISYVNSPLVLTTRLTIKSVCTPNSAVHKNAKQPATQNKCVLLFCLFPPQRYVSPQEHRLNSEFFFIWCLCAAIVIREGHRTFFHLTRSVEPGDVYPIYFFTDIKFYLITILFTSLCYTINLVKFDC